MQWPVLMAEGGGEEGGSGASASTGSSAGTTTAEAPAARGPTPESAQPAPTSLVDWRQDFPEDLRNSPTIQKYATRLDAAKGIEELTHLVGRGVHLPDRRVHPKGSEGYQAAMDKVVAKLQEFDPDYAPPKSSDDYVFTVPEDREMFPEVEKQWREEFFGLRLTQQQVAGVMDAFWRRVAEADNQQQAYAAQRYDEGQRVLRGRFGSSVEETKMAVDALFSDFGRGAFGPDGVQVLDVIKNARTEDGGYLMNNPYFVGTMSSIKKGMMEGQLHDGSPYGAASGQFAQDQARYKELQAKRHSPEGMTAREAQEHARLAEDLAKAEVAGSNRRRVA